MKKGLYRVSTIFLLFSLTADPEIAAAIRPVDRFNAQDQPAPSAFLEQALFLRQVGGWSKMAKAPAVMVRHILSPAARIAAEALATASVAGAVGALGHGASGGLGLAAASFAFGLGVSGWLHGRWNAIWQQAKRPEFRLTQNPRPANPKEFGSPYDWRVPLHAAVNTLDKKYNIGLGSNLVSSYAKAERDLTRNLDANDSMALDRRRMVLALGAQLLYALAQPGASDLYRRGREPEGDTVFVDVDFPSSFGAMTAHLGFKLDKARPRLSIIIDWPQENVTFDQIRLGCDEVETAVHARAHLDIGPGTYGDESWASHIPLYPDDQSNGMVNGFFHNDIKALLKIVTQLPQRRQAFAAASALISADSAREASETPAPDAQAPEPEETPVEPAVAAPPRPLLSVWRLRAIRRRVFVKALAKEGPSIKPARWEALVHAALRADEESPSRLLTVDEVRRALGRTPANLGKDRAESLARALPAAVLEVLTTPPHAALVAASQDQMEWKQLVESEVKESIEPMVLVRSRMITYATAVAMAHDKGMGLELMLTSPAASIQKSYEAVQQKYRSLVDHFFEKLDQAQPAASGPGKTGKEAGPSVAVEAKEGEDPQAAALLQDLRAWVFRLFVARKAGMEFKLYEMPYSTWRLAMRSEYYFGRATEQVNKGNIAGYLSDFERGATKRREFYVADARDLKRAIDRYQDQRLDVIAGAETLPQVFNAWAGSARPPVLLGDFKKEEWVLEFKARLNPRQPDESEEAFQMRLLRQWISGLLNYVFQTPMSDMERIKKKIFFSSFWTRPAIEALAQRIRDKEFNEKMSIFIRALFVQMLRGDPQAPNAAEKERAAESIADKMPADIIDILVRGDVNFGRRADARAVSRSFSYVLYNLIKAGRITTLSFNDLKLFEAPRLSNGPDFLPYQGSSFKLTQEGTLATIERWRDADRAVLRFLGRHPALAVFVIEDLGAATPGRSLRQALAQGRLPPVLLGTASALALTHSFFGAAMGFALLAGFSATIVEPHFVEGHDNKASGSRAVRSVGTALLNTLAFAVPLVYAFTATHAFDLFTGAAILAFHAVGRWLPRASPIRRFSAIQESV